MTNAFAVYAIEPVTLPLPPPDTGCGGENRKVQPGVGCYCESCCMQNQ